MKKGFFLLLALTLVFTLLAGVGSRESIVICASSEQYRNDSLQAQLSEKFPQYNIIVMYMSTGKAAAKVYAEGSDTEIDILVGLETGYLNKIKASLADISGKSRLPYLEGLTPADNGNRWVTWERQAGAIVVNRAILDKYGLEAPKTYADLLKPEYRGLIAMPDPKSSGTGYFFYKNWVNLWGEEAALSYVDALHGNLKQFTESGSGPIKLLKQGEVAIGLALTFQAVTEINSGQPFEIIFPPEGSPYSLTGTAILEGHENKTGVSEVYDYIIHEGLLQDKAQFSPEIICQNQTVSLPNYPTNILYADMTGIQDDKEKERLLALWKY
ncbi:MAG: extracellular solute-binding protein [Oscillospiraceae bacterium]|nr:extracellular solute-binding protein [Oscillospiraceae bacterium]